MAKQLTKKQGHASVNVLPEKDATYSLKNQKQLVRRRIKKYRTQPDKLIDDANAWKAVDAS